MKNIILIILIFFSFNLFANPPKKIILNFSGADKTLSVKIEHNVTKSDKHYISSVKVYLNDKEITKKEYTKQSSNECLDDFFAIENTKPGDVIKVVATCNQSGTLSEVYTIPE